MGKKSIVITLVAHQGYIYQQDNATSKMLETEYLFSAISDTYLPLLDMFETLDLDAIPFKLVLVLTPTLCTLLSDYDVQNRYIAWLDQLILLGEHELQLCLPDSPRFREAEACLSRVRKNRHNFTEVYKSDLLSAFRYYADRGSIELMATAATSAFLPYYSDLPEAINAQIEAGVQSHRQFFGVVPDGFWLPAMGYTSGLDRILRNYNFSYTILDAHGVLFADPLPKNGIFSPVKSQNGLVLFARDAASHTMLSGPGGFINHTVYRDQDRDIAFEADRTELESYLGSDGIRTVSGFKYWSKEVDTWYDSAAAERQVLSDAREFVEAQYTKLQEASRILCTDNVSVTCVFNAKVFGNCWFEGIKWLEHVFRTVAEYPDLIITDCAGLASDKGSLQEINPFISAATGTGYGENLLDTSNGWMLEYARKACERMIYLAERFPDDSGLKARTLNLAAKEVLLAQSSDWPAMLSQRVFPEYAESQFKKNVLAFTTVFDSLGASTISTEWLTNMEQEHPLFPWMNYHIFNTKK